LKFFFFPLYVKIVWRAVDDVSLIFGGEQAKVGLATKASLLPNIATRSNILAKMDFMVKQTVAKAVGLSACNDVHHVVDGGGGS